METGVECNDHESGEGVGAVSEEDGDRFVEYVFTEFIDVAIDVLVERGLTEKAALDTVFHVATVLSERKALPAFPGEGASTQETGAWVVAAADYGFIKFCEDAVR